jgi:zinc transporter ZupT
MAGLVAMLAVFLVVSVEMFFAMKGAKHLHANEYESIIGTVEGSDEDGADECLYSAEYSRSREQLGEMRDGHSAIAMRGNGAASENLIDGTSFRYTGHLDEGKDSHDSELSELDLYEDDGFHIQDRPPLHPHSRTKGHKVSINNRPRAGSDILFQNPQRQLVQCLLLEAGILFHSIFIGMALSVATGTSFVVLLVAISFHQTFEGFALGARIASLIPDLFPSSSPKPWLMACAYGTTTPVGQAIGLILHNLYDPASTTGLLMVGFTNAMSSGLLLFAGLVELLAEDFLSDSSYKTLRGRRRIEACIAVATGAMLMAFVGAFA